MKEALKHLKAITEAFGPDEGVEFDQKAWSALHTAIKEALAQQADHSEQHLDMVKAQPAQQEPVGWMLIQGRHEELSHWPLDDDEISRGWEQYPLYTTPPQRTEERNFCSRCGKRTADLTVIHTCTPPQERT